MWMVRLRDTRHKNLDIATIVLSESSHSFAVGDKISFPQQQKENKNSFLRSFIIKEIEHFLTLDARSNQSHVLCRDPQTIFYVEEEYKEDGVGW